MIAITSSVRRASMPLFALNRAKYQVSQREEAQNSPERRIAGGNSGVSACLMSCFFCASLWLSLAFAIWMSRGWIGLLFSGQVLSAATFMVRKLSQRTQCAIAACSATASRWEEKRNVP
jgi:hypothetical protein